MPTMYYPGKKDHHERVTTERPHPTGGSCPPGRIRKGEVDSDSLFRVFRCIPWLISDPSGAAYPGKKDHHQRVTTERPHPTGGSCPREGHGNGKLIRILFSVYFGGFRG